MSKQKPSLNSEYKKILTKLLTTAQKYSHLWEDSAYIPGALPLFSYWICEQDNDCAYYGITKNKRGKLVFCYTDGKTENPLRRNEKGEQTSIQNVIRDLQRYHVPIEELQSRFLAEIKEPLRRYEILNKGIEEKVRRKLRKLETELSNI